MHLGQYILRRVGASLVVLIGVSIVIFFIARVIPGDPARIALGPTATPEMVELMRDRVTVQMMALHLEIEQNIPEGLSPEGEQMARALAYAVRGIPTDEEQRFRWDQRGL